MSGLNRWQGIINLAADAEPRFTQGGQHVLNFRGACTETFQSEGKESKEVTTWINCVLWGKRGESLARHLTKGTKLYVEGALRIGTYDDKDGNKKTKVEIQVKEVEFMGGGKRDDAAPNTSRSPGRNGQRPADAPPGGGRGFGGGGGRAPAPNPDDDGRGGNGPDSEIPF